MVYASIKASIESKVPDLFKVQKGSKEILKTGCIPWKVQPEYYKPMRMPLWEHETKKITIQKFLLLIVSILKVFMSTVQIL